MFTGYAGLDFIFPITGHTAKLVLQEGTTLGYIYTDCEPPHKVWDIEETHIEGILNKQGKAPKRIQYEVYLNAYYKHTDNAIDKMDARYYSFDKLLADWNNPPYEVGDRLYYSPACKLPSKYLPTQVEAVGKLNTLWCSPYSKWSYKRHIVYDIVDNAVGCLSSNETYWEYTGYNSIDKASLMIGAIKKNYPEHHVLALACKVNIVNVTDYQNTIPFMDVEETTNTIEDELFGDDGRIGLFDETDSCDSDGNVVWGYQFITGRCYIQTFQLDLTHYPVLPVPSEGDDVAYNIISDRVSNEVMLLSGYYMNGKGTLLHEVDVVPLVFRSYSTPALCCRIPK